MWVELAEALHCTALFLGSTGPVRGRVSVGGCSDNSRTLRQARRPERYALGLSPLTVISRSSSSAASMYGLTMGHSSRDRSLLLMRCLASPSRTSPGSAPR